MPRPNTTEEIKKYKADYSKLSDDEILGKMSDFNSSAPQRIAGEFILAKRKKDADPTESLLTDLTARIANIETASTKPETKTWAFWLGLAGVLLSVVAILLSAAMLAVMLSQ